MNTPNGIVSFDKNDLYFNTAEQAIRCRFQVENFIAAARDFKAQFDKRFIELTESGELPKEGLALSETEKIYTCKEKKERFKTAEIYDLFSVQQELRDILPANPAFKKTALAGYLGDKEKVKEFIETEWTDKVIVKSFDSKFIK
jgi:hypothetical protein